MSLIKSFLNKKIVAASFLFLLVSIGTLWQVEKRIQADEWIWVPVGVMFVDHIQHGNFHSTQLSTRPGVTVRWISGTTTLLAERFGGVEVIRKKGYIYVEPRGYVINRIVFGLLTAGFAAAIFILLLKLFDWQKAAAISGLIALHPVTLLKSAGTWADLLLAFFMLFSLLCYLLFWKKDKVAYLLAAGIFFGLSIATKAAGVVLIPAFLVASVLTKPSIQTLKRGLFSIVAVGFFGLATFYLIYPYLWQNYLGFFDRYVELTREISVEERALDVLSFLYYPKIFFKTDPILTTGSALFFIPLLVQFLQKKVLPTPLIFTAASAIIYIAMLSWVGQFGYWNGRKIASSRYIGPAIYFMILFLIAATSYLTKKGFKVLWLVPAAMFFLNLYSLLLFLPSEVSGG